MLKEARAELLYAIDFLVSQHQDPIRLKLLAGLITATIWDEDFDKKFKALAWRASTDLYDTISINLDWEECINDPINPRNWHGYNQSQNE
jgi:hypothetical protein